MLPPTTPDQDHEAASPTPARKTITDPDFSGTPQPIEEYAGRADFPQCALGLYLDIRGFAGVVMEIVKQSLKVRSPDGITQSFNAYRLKSLYAPPDHSEPLPVTVREDRPTPAVAFEMDDMDEPKPPAPVREYIAEPDFSAPVQPISDFASQPGFPKCSFGAHVDIGGHIGVVVEIVKGSIKVQNDVGATRSFNIEVLKKLHGKP